MLIVKSFSIEVIVIVLLAIKVRGQLGAAKIKNSIDFDVIWYASVFDIAMISNMI